MEGRAAIGGALESDLESPKSGVSDGDDSDAVGGEGGFGCCDEED